MVAENPSMDDHELSWLLRDAIGLSHLGRRYSALLLLLCGIDAFAQRAYPELTQRRRFEKFLRETLPPHTQIENFNIRIPKTQQTLRIEEILYKYLQNPVIHEGAHLDIGKPRNFAVCLDWNDGAVTVNVDNDADQMILSGRWIIEVLANVIIDAITNELSSESKGVL